MKKLVSIVIALVLVQALAVCSFAANFTPSATAKAAPELVEQIGPDGNSYAALICDENGTVLQGIASGDIIITAYADVDKAELTIAEMLRAAYTDLSEKEIAELVEEITTLVDNAENLVVYSLFDVTVTGIYKDLLDSAEGNYLKVVFKTGIGATEEEPVVIYHCPDDSWDVIDSSVVTNNGDGTLTLAFHKLCPVAFLTSPVIVDNPEVISPATGIQSINMMPVVIAMAGVAAIAACAIAFSKKKA